MRKRAGLVETELEFGRLQMAQRNDSLLPFVTTFSGRGVFRNYLPLSFARDLYEEQGASQLASYLVWREATGFALTALASFHGKRVIAELDLSPDDLVTVLVTSLETWIGHHSANREALSKPKICRCENNSVVDHRYRRLLPFGDERIALEEIAQFERDYLTGPVTI